VDRALPGLANLDNVDTHHRPFSGVQGKENYRTAAATVNGKPKKMAGERQAVRSPSGPPG
jgi:hypothetical protein